VDSTFDGDVFHHSKYRRLSLHSYTNPRKNSSLITQKAGEILQAMGMTAVTTYQQDGDGKPSASCGSRNTVNTSGQIIKLITPQSLVQIMSIFSVLLLLLKISSL
jgi:hypothetical protein